MESLYTYIHIGPKTHFMKKNLLRIFVIIDDKRISKGEEKLINLLYSAP